MTLRWERPRRPAPEADDERQAPADVAPTQALPRPARDGWIRLAVGCAATIFVLETARAWLLPVVIAAILAFLLAPVVRRLALLRIPPSIGAGLVVAAIVGSLCAAAALVAEPAAALWARLPSAEAKLLQLEAQAFRGVRPTTEPAGGPATTSPSKAVATASATPTEDALVRAFRSGEDEWRRRLPREALAAAVTAAATLFLLYFLLVSEQGLVAQGLQACTTGRQRARLLGGLRQVQREIRAFLLTMILTSFVLGIATGLALAAMRFPDAAFWGAFTAVLTVIPYVGPALVTVALVLAGSAFYGADVHLLMPAAVFLLLHFLESNLLSPWLMGVRLRVRPVFVLVSVLVWSALWGLAGGFVAVPILLALRAVGLRSRWSRPTRLFLLDAAPPPAPQRPRPPGALLR